MAFVFMNVYSKSLKRNTSLTAVFPTDLPQKKTENNLYYERSMKILYVLHGMECDMLEWPLRSNITELAYKYNLAVIAPSGESRWYVDHAGEDEKCGRFTGEELVAVTRKMFSLSDRREDTLIAGFSMGGFGAIMNGFAYPDIFGKIGAMAPGGFWEEKPLFDRGEGPSLEDLADRLALECQLGQIDLDVYVGKEDFLLEENRRLFKFCREKNIKMKYTEGEGGHHWSSWNMYLEEMVQNLTEAR